MADTTTINAVKLAMRLTTSAYDNEIGSLIDAALADLGITDIYNTNPSSPLVFRAVATYCRLHFGTPSDYDKLKASYDEQKGQLITATGYGISPGV